jgi:hypothetical protein
MLDELRQQAHAEALYCTARLVAGLVLIEAPVGSRDVCPTYSPARPINLGSCKKTT